MWNRLVLSRRRLLLLLVPTVGAAVVLTLGVFTALSSGRYLHGTRHTATQISGPRPLVVAPGRASGPAPLVSESKPPPWQTSRPRGAIQVARALPNTPDPRRYAIAYATALFSYDTRTQSEAAWTTILTTGLDTTTDVRADNTEDLANRTPPTAVWQTMASSKQYATFAVNRVWVPKLWTEYASQYPAGAAAVSVSGTQDVAWAGGASEVPQAATLLLLCPPYNDACVVNRIAAQVLR